MNEIRKRFALEIKIDTIKFVLPNKLGQLLESGTGLLRKICNPERNSYDVGMNYTKEQLILTWLRSAERSKSPGERIDTAYERSCAERWIKIIPNL